MTFKKVIIKDNKDVRETLYSITKGVLFDECREKLIEEKKGRGFNFYECQKELYSHTVRYIKKFFNNLGDVGLRPVEEKEETLNCHAYALRARDCIDGYQIESLIEKKHLTALTELRVGSLVLYFDDMQSDKPTHTGVIKELREDGNHIIESKWGKLPAIFTHSLNTVPTDYGNYVAYFKKPSLKEVENMLGQILEIENS